MAAGSSGRAVVIGGSIAGLLAARVLAGHFGHVVVLDRDRLPPDPGIRAGTPQARHSHRLLARGREAMEDLVPGLTDELVAMGGLAGDAQSTSAVYIGSRRLASGTSGLVALNVSRPLLEWHLRQRVTTLPQVEVRDRTSALDLVLDDTAGRVTGVSVSHISWPGTCVTVPADLVVDASGRTARTTEWLGRRGYPAPDEEHVRVDVVCATRTFRRAADGIDGTWAVQQPPRPGLPRLGVMLAQEGERWSVSVGGYRGERPPTDLDGFVDFARSMSGPIGDLVAQLEPLDTGAHYRFPEDVRRRFERLSRFPDGLVVVGDAWCAFNPSFGQGMTVAALEALELRACLAQGTHELARRYFRRAAPHVDVPWALAAGLDRRLTQPGRLSPGARLWARYLDALLLAATEDPTLAAAFLRVGHVGAQPGTLATPWIAARVAAGAIRRRWGGLADQPAVTGAESCLPSPAPGLATGTSSASRTSMPSPSS